MGASNGSTVIYLIALKLGRTALLIYLGKFRISDKKLEKVERWFEKYGDKAVLFGRMVPVFREMISVPAGLLKMSVKKFLAYTILGSCSWGVTTVLVGYFFGLTAFEMII